MMFNFFRSRNMLEDLKKHVDDYMNGLCSSIKDVIKIQSDHINDADKKFGFVLDIEQRINRLEERITDLVSKHNVLTLKSDVRFKDLETSVDKLSKKKYKHGRVKSS